MSDFAEAILTEVRKDYSAFKNKESVKKMADNIIKSSNYKDVYPYSRQLAERTASSIIKEFSAIEGEIYKGTLTEVLEPMLSELHKDIEVVSTAVQNNKNAAAGLKLKPQTKKFNGYHSYAIGKEVAESEHIDLLTEKVLRYASDTIDEIQRANIEFLDSSTDANILVTRIYDGIGVHDRKDTCEFCVNLAGAKTFKGYEDCMYDDIWRRHGGCGCQIDYSVYTAKGRIRKDTNIKNFKKA